MRDERFMRRALSLAARALGDTSPNPMVGAIVVAPDGTVAGEGFHERAGAAHAEIIALAQAAERARGATLYVTLEPCTRHGRTPPCVDAIVAAGVARVVAAAIDPDKNESGRGIERLRAAGIAVETGIAESEAAWLNRLYAKHRATGRPFVSVKMAMTIDGAIGEVADEKRRLTGRQAAAYVRSLRREHDAVMVGVGTAVVDDPLLTVRPFKQRHVPYVRIVVDSTARLSPQSRLVKDQSRAKTIVAATEFASGERVEALKARGVEVLLCDPEPDGRVDVRDLLVKLGARGMLGVLCEGGPTLAGRLLAAGLVDELHAIVAPQFLGTSAAAPAFRGITQPLSLRFERSRMLGADALIVAAVLGAAR